MSASAPRDEELMALIDGELAPERRAALEAWLATHPQEAARVAQWRAQDAALKAAYAGVAAETVPTRLRATVTRPARRRLPLAAGFAATFLLGAGAGAGAALWWGTQSSVPVSLIEQAIATHRLYTAEVRHAVEVAASDEPHLKTWLSKRLEHPLTLPDLRDQGLSLVGGRLVPCLGSPGALLMYETAAGERFTLLVTKAGVDEAVAFRWRTVGAVGAVTWHDGPFRYVLSGPADKDRLVNLARVVYERLA